ncbi:uncharacterized protein At4g06744-like [Cornus florida]|uniref:uncharacterized protein At4g06744-like n=1 Tax=Cornus florida TaxID=4283 RepID=UPI002896B95D|nr:uncharacterized protein At4g06744-like [Cornus florida]
MGNLYFSAAFLLLNFLVFQLADRYTTSSATQNIRKPLERYYTPHPPKPECSLPPPPPPPPCVAPELLRDIRSIQKFKNRITRDPLGITKTWQGRGICTDSSKYKGFICGKINSTDRFRVAGVKFNGFYFDGNLLNVNDFIEALEDLVFFHANSNTFTGPIPAKVATLPYFFELDLSNNMLTGSFPNEILGATNLTFLDLRFNQLTGTLPPQVFKLDLDVLFLNNNYFCGYLPDSLGSTPVLYLTLANNQFTGPIPKSIGLASNTLIEVLFLNNRLSGCLPHEIGLLKKVTIFDASLNQLTGGIPFSFGCLEKMELLNLSFNRLYGEVPEIVCRLKNLYKLTLNNNYFTQVGPECRKLIMRNVLDVNMNCILDLPSQRSKEECDSFFTKQQPCPPEQKNRYIPCRVDNSTAQVTSDHPRTPPIAPSPSYAALIKHS